MSRHLVLRGTRLPISARVPARALAVVVVLLALLLVAMCLATAFGTYPLSPLGAARAILGDASRIDVFVVQQVRLPRVLEGALVGAALALSGAIFQALSRNPLASPDVLGINEGAAVVAVWMIITGAPYDLVPLGAFGGAMAVIAILAVLGVRRHFSLTRLLLIGLAINVLAATLVTYLLTRPVASNRLVTAQQWLYGSVASADWQYIRIVGLALVVVTVVVWLLGRQLNALALGEELAVAVGVKPNRLQIVLTGLAALLAAAVVSVAGPIGFVAFISPHIARRLARTSSAASLFVAMIVGALLVVVADYAAKRVLEPIELPVGVTTTSIGAPYLLYLLVRAERDTGVA